MTDLLPTLFAVMAIGVVWGGLVLTLVGFMILLHWLDNRPD